MSTTKFKFNDGGRSDSGYKGFASDCVCRSIAIASGKPYSEVYSDLVDYSKKLESKGNSKKGKGKTHYSKTSHPRTGITKKVYQEYLKDIGFVWVPTMKIGSGCKVHLSADELPSGNLVVAVSKHMTSVIDGVINDTYDCSRDGSRCVYGYFYKK